MPVPTKKKNVIQMLNEVIVLVDKIGVKTHVGAVMVVTAALDRLLEEALLTKMNKLNSPMPFLHLWGCESSRPLGDSLRDKNI
jgi:hypothetical protein